MTSWLLKLRYIPGVAAEFCRNLLGGFFFSASVAQSCLGFGEGRGYAISSSGEIAGYPFLKTPTRCPIGAVPVEATVKNNDVLRSFMGFVVMSMTARSASDNAYLLGSRSLIAATIGRIALISRSCFVPKTLANEPSSIEGEIRFYQQGSNAKPWRADDGSVA
jgi:hypothetical protein